MNDFDTIYANGCSFTCAGGLNFQSVRDLYKKVLNMNLNEDYLQYSYPNLIAKELKLNIINEAFHGGSINRLIRKTYQYVYDNQSSVNKTLFILELPPMWRDEIYSNRFDRLMNITWGTIKFPNKDLTDVAAGYDAGDVQKISKDLQSYFYNFVNTDFEYKKSMNNLLGLISFLKVKTNNLILIDNTFFEEFLKTNNIKHDFNFVNFDNIQMQEWFIKNKLTINDELHVNIDGHAGIVGNELIANVVLKYLIKNNFISKIDSIKLI
jgi:hypothetical protein